MAATPPGRDKHPAYDLVNGPSGKGVDDLYTPEITNVGGLDNTVSVVCTVNNDALKVQGILNEIKGLNHDGAPGPGVPAVFGMNFQAVSVGQKLEKDNSDGSCLADTLFNGAARWIRGWRRALRPLSPPTGCRKTDAALGQHDPGAQSSAHLRFDPLPSSAAKHGQSPINPVKTNKPGHFADLVCGSFDQAGRHLPIQGPWPSPNRQQPAATGPVRLRSGRRYRAHLAAGPDPDSCGCLLLERQCRGTLHR